MTDCDMDELLNASAADAPSPRSSRKRRSVWRTVLDVCGVLLIFGGLAVGVAALLWPNQVEQAYGEVQIKIGQVRALNETSIARLGGSAGKAMVDQCDGTFTEMTSYQREGVPPVWAAHNNCGGDIILPLEIGDEIVLDRAGGLSRYEIVDIRETPKVWVTTEALIGLKGELALQSCFYGGSDVPMKFIGLEPVDESTESDGS